MIFLSFYVFFILFDLNDQKILYSSFKKEGFELLTIPFDSRYIPTAILEK
jgi:hypothetical protein